MICVRPVELGDLDALEGLAMRAGQGMTNLPPNREALQQRIEHSRDSFARAIAPKATNCGDGGEGSDGAVAEELYLFVLEDTVDGAIAGCCGIMARVGLSRPFYSFRLVNLPHTSQELERYETYAALQMVDEYRGAAEVGILYLAREYRGGGNGKLLSRGRFMFLAAFPERFPKRVMAELRGVQDERGRSVFWEGLGRHFFDMDFSKADYLSALGNYQFIADLMPKHPVYVCLLPRPTQAVIGVAHESSRPALAMLQREGFRFEGCVDVFDAGPTVHCPLDQILTVRESREAVVGEVVESLESAAFIIATTTLDRFRLCRGGLGMRHNEVVLAREVAQALEVSAGDRIRYVRF